MQANVEHLMTLELEFHWFSRKPLVTKSKTGAEESRSVSVVPGDGSRVSALPAFLSRTYLKALARIHSQHTNQTPTSITPAFPILCCRTLYRISVAPRRPSRR